MSRCVALCFVGLVLLAAGVAAAQPAAVPIQGTLTDLAGDPVDGVHSITFRIYNVDTGGAAIYTETQAAVAVESGVFSAYLGDVTPLDLAIFDGGNRWLGITVGTDSEMTPRLRFGTVPYAAYAGRGGSSIPAGAVMFFDLAACPTGWTALVRAQGRTIVGLNPGGTLQGGYPTTFPGSALADQAPRNITGASAVPAHTHTLSNAGGAAHSHTLTNAAGNAHTHTLTNAAHDEAAFATASGGGHNHAVPLNGGGGGTISAVDWFSNSASTFPLNTTGTGNHAHSIDVPSHSHNNTLAAESAHTHANTLASESGHTHANTLSATGNTNVDVTMPYVQLLACRKD